MMFSTELVDGIDVAGLHIWVRPATQNLSRSFRTRFGVAGELQETRQKEVCKKDAKCLWAHRANGFVARKANGFFVPDLSQCLKIDNAVAVHGYAVTFA